MNEFVAHANHTNEVSPRLAAEVEQSRDASIRM